MTANGIGARVPRKEDQRFLRGEGRFVGDIILPGMVEAAFLRSPFAHARILSVTPPPGAEGAVFAAGHLAGVKPIRAPSSIPGYKPSDQPPLATGKVRFVGEPVVMVIAATRAEAEDLAEQVVVEYEELPPIIDTTSALAAGAPLVHDHWGDNLFLTTAFDGDVETVAKDAAVTIHREFSLARQCMVPMEGKGVLATWDAQADQLVVTTSSQIPHMIRTALADSLGLDQHRLRVVAPDVGGGFGYKVVVHPEEICIAWAAMRLRRPVRWLEDRREHLVAGANTRQHHYRITAHADRRGRLLALDAEVTVDTGAYSVWPFTACLEAAQAGGNLPGPYRLEAYRCRTYSVATNKPGFTPYRGVARTGVCFAIELTMDAIARAVGREPVDVRLENLVPPEAMPYDNVTRKHYDSGDYPEALRRAADRIGLADIRHRQKQAEADGRLIGVGFGIYTEQTAHGTKVFAAWGLPLVPGFEQASARFTPDGTLEVRVGVHNHGQGMETTLAQVASEILGLGLDRIRIIHGDTATTPYSTGTYASRVAVMAGGAVARACQVLARRLKHIGGHLLHCPADQVSLTAGRAVGPSGSVDLSEIAGIWYLRPEKLPADVEPGGLEVTEGYKPATDGGVFSYAAHAAVVALDPETGEVEILDYVVVEDCGTPINPLVVEGQTYGGTAQGIGTALYEEVHYDSQGQPGSATLADYLIPGATEVPTIRIEHMSTPSPYTEFGIKGVGEGGAIAPPATIANAVNDALRSLNAEVSETPVTPRRVLAAIRAAR